MPTAPTWTGAEGTTALLSDNRYIDMSQTVSELQPDETPFVVLAKRLPHSVTGDVQFSHLEHDQEPRFDTTSGTATTTATSIGVNNGSYFAQHDTVLVPRTNEVFRVQSVSGNTLTVVRGVGATTPGTGVAMNSGEELLIMGSAQPEGDTSKPARSGQPTKVTNYTQIFREPWELTDTAKNVRNMTSPDEWARQAAYKGVEHLKEIEYALLFGRPYEDLSGSQPRRTTGGVRYFIQSSSVTDVGGTMTETELQAALRTVFRYGSREKIAIGGALPLSVISQFAANKVQVVNQRDNRYGVTITQYVTPVGTLNLLPVDYAFEGATLGGELFILDMNDPNMKYRYIQNRDTHIRPNIQAPDADTSKSEYVTECGLQFGSPSKHGRVTNITG
jgi:hypothetical protein